MNRRMVVFLLSRIMAFEAILMLPSFIVGLIYREAGIAALCFLPVIGVLALLGLFGLKKPENTTIYAREGFLTVAAAWVLMSLFGAVPLWLCGGFNTFWDCLFEIVSGFTTTGASVLETVEQLPHCILFWRSFSHWIGGMGVLVFVLAVMPMSEERSMHLMRAEVPGPVVGKLVPRMRDTAKILYAVYSALTVILIIMLWAVCRCLNRFATRSVRRAPEDFRSKTPGSRHTTALIFTSCCQHLCFCSALISVCII